MSQPPEPSANASSADAPDARRGFISALGAYAIWGGLPLLFKTVATINPLVVVASRVIWSVVFVGAVVIGRGNLGELKAAWQSKATVRAIIVSTALLGSNWLILVWAVAHDYVLEVSFGYFINPLLSVVMGILFLGERLNRLQTLSAMIAVVGVAVQAVGIGGLPMVSLSLATNFAIYGYIRKTVPVGSTAGLLAETLILLPFALAYLAYVFATQGVGPYGDPVLFFWLVMTGPVTSMALIFFAYAARQLPLSLIGMIQYIAPSAHFVLAIWLFGESINLMQLISFGLIWLSLAVYTFDSLKRGSARRRAEVG